MKRTTISTKGQVILPKAIRDRRHWTPGTELVVEDRPEGVMLKSAGKNKTHKLADFAGMLKYKGRAKSIDDMNAAIVDEVRRRHARGRY